MPATIFPQTSPADVVQTGAIRGVQPGAARPDHVHTGAGMLSALAPTNSAFGDVAATGTSPAVTRRDHLHGREANPITAHVAAADPHTGYVQEADANWIDLTDAGATTLHTHAGGAHTHVDSEVPAGTVDGVNDTFTLAATPTAGTLHLYKNGLRQKAGAGNDYTLAVATITFLAGNIPLTGDSILADYLT